MCVTGALGCLAAVSIELTHGGRACVCEWDALLAQELHQWKYSKEEEQVLQGIIPCLLCSCNNGVDIMSAS